MTRVMISCGEPSGDLYAGALATEIRDFLISRRARLSPDQAGIRVRVDRPRRVPGLRREVAVAVLRNDGAGRPG